MLQILLSMENNFENVSLEENMLCYTKQPFILCFDHESVS